MTWTAPRPATSPLQVSNRPTGPLPATRHMQPIIAPVRYQNPEARRSADGTTSSDYQIQLVPPGLERLSRLDSEDRLQERIRQETLERDPNERITFPEEPILSRDTYNGRGPIWQGRQMVVEPNYTCYGRLLFEQPNQERAGWDLGIVSPLISSGKFVADVALLPWRIATRPCDWAECSAGRCLPGDPTPLLLYPPELTVTGLTAEAAVIAALIVIFP